MREEKKLVAFTFLCANCTIIIYPSITMALGIMVMAVLTAYCSIIVHCQMTITQPNSSMDQNLASLNGIMREVMKKLDHLSDGTCSLRRESKYTFYPINYSWKDARKMCQFHNADLVSINSPDELDFVNDLTTSFEVQLRNGSKIRRFWTSGHKKSSQQGIFWGNSPDSMDINRELWLEGEPSDNQGNENCIDLFRGHPDGSDALRLNDESCSTSSFFICEL